MSTHFDMHAPWGGQSPRDFIRGAFGSAMSGHRDHHGPPEPPEPPGPGHHGRGRRGRSRRGFGPFGPVGAFGPVGPFGPGGPLGPSGPFGDRGQWGGRGQRARRGDVRAAALALLAEQPMNGYQIIQEIRQRSDGRWKPSSGSVYPALQQLEDEGLITAGDHEGRRAFSLTDEGRAYVEANPDELAAPWDTMAADSDTSGITEARNAMGRTAGAFMQVCAAGTDEQREQAIRILDDARKSLYRLLAEDDTPTPQ